MPKQCIACDGGGGGGEGGRGDRLHVTHFRKQEEMVSKLLIIAFRHSYCLMLSVLLSRKN